MRGTTTTTAPPADETGAGGRTGARALRVQEALVLIQRVRADLARIGAGVADETLSVADAERLCFELGPVAKHAGALCLRFAGLGGKDSPRLVSVSTGTPAATTRRQLETMERIGSSPELKDAVASGHVSVDQAAVIAPALVRSPWAAPRLVEAARSGSFEELKEAAARTLRTARSEEDQVALEERLHARRRAHVRTGADGAVCLEARFSPVEGARLIAALEKETDTCCQEAFRAGVPEPKERLAADALVALVTGSARSAGAQVLVRVDAAALRRGSLEEGEICEIDGVGPVSLAAARSFLPEATLTTLVRDGADVLSVSSTTRAVPGRLLKALEERDPRCVVPGCGATRRLEVHHWRTGYATFGATELDNLCRLCPVHHRLQTKEGWRIGGGPGKWVWVPPKRPRPSG